MGCVCVVASKAHNTTKLSDVDHVVMFVLQHAEDHAILLPGCTVGVIEKFPLCFDAAPFSLYAIFCCVTVSLPFCYCVTVHVNYTSGQLKFQCAHSYMILSGLCVA